MDEEIAITSVLADDRKSESSHSDNKGAKELNEKSELIFEIKTICNIDSLVQNCKFFENKSSFTFSDPKQPDFPMDTNTAHLCFHSESFMNENNFERDIPHSPTNEEKNAPKQMQESFEQPENYFVPDRTDKTTPILENEIKLPSENEESSAHHEYQQCTDSSEVLDDTKRSSRRNSKRKKDFDGCCPICGVTVRLNDLESHYNQEVERLSKISRCSKKMHLEDVPKNEAFDLVRKNREQRLTARVARYSARAKNEVKCPVCSLRMSGTAEEINKHVAFCIQDEDSDVNVDDTDSFEEYEIGDETRIRPISLVPGGYRSLHGDSVRQTAEDEDLNVDVDDTIAYGDPQYSEIDVIPNTSSEKDRSDLEQLRKAVDSSARPQNLEISHKWSKADSDTEISELSKSLTDSDPVVSSLKEKIKSLEDQDKNVRCLICLESYTKPVVSTTCWHVHCEECWLMTMGVKKLCPQCNMIVFPSDLRKIYL